MADPPTAPDHVEFHAANHSDRDLKLASVSPLSGTFGVEGREEPLFPFDVTHRPHDGSVPSAKSSQAFAIRRSNRNTNGFSSAVVQYRVEGKVRGSNAWVQYYIAASDVNRRAEPAVVMSGCSFSRHALHHFTGEDLGNSRGTDIFHGFECMGPRWGATTFSFSQ
jgi:hypothetical protein